MSEPHTGESIFFDYILYPFIVGCLVFAAIFIIGLGFNIVSELIIKFGLQQVAFIVVSGVIVIFGVWVIGIIIITVFAESVENG